MTRRQAQIGFLILVLLMAGWILFRFLGAETSRAMTAQRRQDGQSITNIHRPLSIWSDVARQSDALTVSSPEEPGKPMLSDPTGIKLINTSPMRWNQPVRPGPPPGPEITERLIIADFNKNGSNNLGGIYGNFAPSENEDRFVCLIALDDREKRGARGKSLQLTYNVDAPGAYNGFWMKLGPSPENNHLDGSRYRNLRLWVKPDARTGIPSRFKLELKSNPGRSLGKVYISELTSGWQAVAIPLTQFAAQGLDLTSLDEMVIVFEQRAVTPAVKSSIWVDDVSLEK